MIIRATIAISLLGLGASSALAQQVDQIAPASPAGDAVEQIGADDRGIAAPAPADREVDSTAQLSRADASQAPASQLTSERRTVRTPLQLNHSGRTAEPVEALSRPSEGRTAAVAAVGGTDRCDDEGGGAAKRAACARVIETRSAEFEPEPVTLSPEQRLLVEQRLREAPARSRLSSSGMDPDSLEAQAVASLTLRPAPQPDREEKPEDDRTAAQAAAAAIVSAIVNGTGPQPPN